MPGITDSSGYLKIALSGGTVSGTITFSSTVNISRLNVTSGYPIQAYTGFYCGSSEQYGGQRVQEDDGLHLVLGPDSGYGNHHLIITSNDWRVTDHDHDVADTNPIMFHHSYLNPNNSNQEYGRFEHDQSDYVISSGHGGIKFGIIAQSARGTLTFTGAPVNNETMVINATTITAKDSGASTDEFNIGGTAAANATALAAAVNAGTEGSNVHAYASGDTVIFEWLTAGVAGNAIVFTEAMTNCSVDGGGTLGGTHAGVAASTPLHVREDDVLAFGTYNATGDVACNGYITIKDSGGTDRKVMICA